MTDTGNQKSKLKKTKETKKTKGEGNIKNKNKQKGGYIDPSMSMFNSFPLLTAERQQINIRNEFSNLKEPNKNIDLGKQDVFKDILKFKTEGKQLNYHKAYQQSAGNRKQKNVYEKKKAI